MPATAATARRVHRQHCQYGKGPEKPTLLKVAGISLRCYFQPHGRLLARAGAEVTKVTTLLPSTTCSIQ